MVYIRYKAIVFTVKVNFYNFTTKYEKHYYTIFCHPRSNIFNPNGGGWYLFITDPYGLKPLLFGGSAPAQSSSATEASMNGNIHNNANTSASTTGEVQGEVVSGGFEFSSAQVEALVSLAIDPAAAPSSISAEQEACFAGVLGEARVIEIKAGAVPSAFEFMKAESCI